MGSAETGRMHPARSAFAAGRGYLAACTLGLPAAPTRAALARDLERWSIGRATAGDYSAIVERGRGHAATLLGADPRQVAIGSQLSMFTAIAAASLPRGARVVCVDGDFSSVVAPFLARGDLRVRHVPVDALADAAADGADLVAYALVQSATGHVADHAAVAAAARGVDALTFVDTTQASGWLPTDALGADVVACHTYKWLNSPRGAAFASFSDRALAEFTPIAPGWYSGTDPWASCYGPDLHLADDATRFDVSPAWPAWVGTEAALGFALEHGIESAHRHDVGLANAFRERLGLEASDSAIVAWPDPDGDALAALGAAGVIASGRAGRARVAFHVWNDEDDVDLAAGAVTTAGAARTR